MAGRLSRGWSMAKASFSVLGASQTLVLPIMHIQHDADRRAKA